MTNYIVVVHFL